MNTSRWYHLRRRGAENSRRRVGHPSGGGGGKPPLQLGSLMGLPDILPSLNIFDAIHIYMDPDDEEGESDAEDMYGFLSNNGVVTIQTKPNAANLNPNAAFMGPTMRPTINIGQFGTPTTSSQFFKSQWNDIYIVTIGPYGISVIPTVQRVDTTSNPFSWRYQDPDFKPIP